MEKVNLYLCGFDQGPYCSPNADHFKHVRTESEVSEGHCHTAESLSTTSLVGNLETAGRSQDAYS